ncbi:hypothetical protein E5676_scaffold682G00040 [Cucumis melo var. makuwa]|uniref:Zf-RVT domain-containing protein n=1 Tax=Cucumis melo var. makuwa TaxID=1194695 RepID=A0A5A7VG93_CUCMM|nr:hypothetical protein E6C27_scaffold17G00040 [Cucumis melo var. makuwa]TYK20853.1 hypothetical protein E5676_scaffold682G00040 [Cucumis melo var. makuwa]
MSKVGDGLHVEYGLIRGCRGVPFLSRLGKGCFMMRQVGGRLDFLILLAQMGNGNGRESMELIDLWDRVQAISPSLSVSDRWVWVPGRQGGFSITSPCEAIRPMGGRGGVESRDHLFFSCPFGGDVWSRVLRVMASSYRIGNWGVELSWIFHQGIGKGVRRKLWRVLWCATIYFIWNERNHRLHGGQARDPNVLFHLIYTCIRARAGSWREDTQLLF